MASAEKLESVVNIADSTQVKLEGAIKSSSDTAAPAVERLTSSAHQTVDRLAQVASQAAQTLDETTRQLQETQIKVMENCRHYVKDHPAASIGMALATGFLLRHFLRLR